MTAEFPAYSIRLGRVRAVIRARRLHALLVTCPENRRFLSGFTAEDAGIAESSGALFITRREAVLVTDGRYGTQAREEARGWAVRIHKKGIPHEVAALASECGVRRLGYEPRYLTCHALDCIKKRLPNGEFIPTGEVVAGMRSVKDAAELEAINRAIRAAEDVFGQVHSEIRPGMTEKEIAWRILAGLFAVSEGPSFPPIVASGPNAALPHAVPTDRAVREGEPIIIDMGARVDGYCSDMTRTVFLGAPDPAMREIYRLVRTAQRAAEDALRAGITGREADRTAREIITTGGHGDRFIHALGHGVGLAVHESPRLSPRERRVLRPGMVVTVEPGIYLPGVGGVRLEDMVLIQEGGARVLSRNDWYYDW